MKCHWFVFLAALLIAFTPARAEKVSEVQARAQAEAFFQSCGTTKAGAASVRLLWTGSDTRRTKASSTNESFFVYGRDGGGFVIVSADTAAGPILGYSTEGTLDRNDMSPALEAWLENLATHVTRAGAKGVRAKGATKAGNEVVMQTARWDQLSPFNNKCPEYAPAGCTPIAMAIALRCIEWPDAGTGELESYEYEDIHGVNHRVEGYSLGYGYEWENMPLTGVTKDNADQISTLVRDCGVMIKAMYSYTDDGTSAYAFNILSALKKHMKCDAAGEFRFSQYSSAYKWVEDITAEIDAGRPVIYGGQNEKGEGHSFVVDGYNENGDFHINWGWGGKENGFFTFPEFGEFTSSHNAIFGLKKDEGGKQADYILVRELATDATEFAVNQGFKVNFSMYNLSDDKFTGSVAMARMSDSGSMKEIISEEISFGEEALESGDGVKVSDLDCVIKEEIGVGDLITLFYKDRYGEWRQAEYDRSNPADAIKSISDAQHLDAATSLSFDKKSKTVLLKTKPGTVCSVHPAVTITKEDDDFHLSGFTGGLYTVTLESGVEKYTFELEL